MTNSKILFDNLVRDIKLNETKDEIKAIALIALNHFGITQTDILSGKVVATDYSEIKNVIERLNNHEPIQYILNEAWFCGNKFFVDRSVLIPRQETELLVDEAARFLLNKKDATILDIGTGSGCIAISLALLFPSASIWAIDISDEALNVARKNAERFHVNINFIKHDILKGPVTNLKCDLVVSNPPYISEEEKGTISKNVIDYEPHLALFTDRSDALIFYRAIAKAITEFQKNSVALVLEINPLFALEIKAIFDNHWTKKVVFKKDFSNNFRVISIQF